MDFFYNLKKKKSIFNANSMDPDQIPQIWHLIWFYSVCLKYWIYFFEDKLKKVNSNMTLTFFPLSVSGNVCLKRVHL